MADYLAKKGVPFRDAHRVVGEVVHYALEKGKELSELSLEEYRRFSPDFDQDVEAISLETSVASRSLHGGTAPSEVAKAISAARKALGSRRG